MKPFWNRRFHWLIINPGVSVFLGGLGANNYRSQWFTWWPVCNNNWLLCCVAGRNNCLRDCYVSTGKIIFVRVAFFFCVVLFFSLSSLIISKHIFLAFLCCVFALLFRTALCFCCVLFCCSDYCLGVVLLIFSYFVSLTWFHFSFFPCFTLQCLTSFVRSLVRFLVRSLAPFARFVC